jgi:class 3 adenylate cyclase
MGPLDSAPMGPLDAREPIRISDADRTEAVGRINQHFTDGRLDFEECSARLDEIYAAKTDVDLERVFRDLPKPSVAPTKPPRFRSARTRVERAVGMATPAIICTAVWAMTGHDSSFWPEWVWFATGIGLLRSVSHDQRQNRRAEALGAAGQLPPGTGAGQRLVLTAVFADIVGSTERASTLGDRRWRELLDGFEHAANDGMSRHDGRKLFTKGDEIVGTFRSPGQAVAYARELRDEASGLGLQLRVGLHTGELEKRHGDLSGIALHIGQRVSELAAPDEILASSTVRDLVHGGGTDFVDRGEHELRGLPGSFHLYAVG